MSKYFQLSLIFVLIMFWVSVAAAQHTIRVPTSNRTVMIDGKLSPNEWSDAARFRLGNLADVYVKQSRGFVWLAVERLNGNDFALDLYIQPGDGAIYDLHSSAKLGERMLQGTSWSDEWKWWNNEGWIANWSRVSSFEQRTFLPEKIREYQISRGRFAGDTWRIMFSLMLPAQPQWGTFSFPESAKSTSTEHWMVLQFKAK